MRTFQKDALVSWLQNIERQGYPWTFQNKTNGLDRCLLSSASLFCKLSKIYSNYFTADKDRLKDIILSFSRPDGMLEDIQGDKNIISETRQAFSGLINIGYEVPDFDCSSFFQEPLYFMRDSEWNNPWGAGAHLSHYMFFMHHSGNHEKIQSVLESLKKFQKPEGWYYKHPPDTHTLVNGIMKVMTAFDAVGIEVPTSNIKGILELVLSFNSSYGGCGIYDLVYVLDKCIEYEVKVEECKSAMRDCYESIICHQQSDGGFSYSLDSCQTGFYGKQIANRSLCGDIHGTTLFSMALVRIDHRLELGLNLCPAIT